MAYSDLQDFLARLESSGKLHWIEQRVDPAWEVSAITRHVFDRYGWDERPALGFRRVGDSPFPLVIGVVGGSPQIYALALSTTVENIPAVWERAQRQPLEPTTESSGPCKEVISQGRQSTSASCRRWFGRRAKIPGPTSLRLW